MTSLHCVTEARDTLGIKEYVKLMERLKIEPATLSVVLQTTVCAYSIDSMDPNAINT